MSVASFVHARVVIEHAGALGDFVMIWPIVRGLVHLGARLEVCAAREKVRLMQRWLEPGLIGAPLVQWLDPDGPSMQALWRGVPGEVIHGVTHVLAFGVDPRRSGPYEAWIQAARARWEGAEVRCIGAPGSDSRSHLWREVVDVPFSFGTRRAGGPVMLHVGAGSQAKRWALDRFAYLRAILQRAGHRVDVIAGEVEEARFTPTERESFAAMGGRFLATYDELAWALNGASLVIVADSGPGHLAAQIGVPVASLFGPTDPVVWRPIGVCVDVIAPAVPTPDMAWLSVDTVAERAFALLERLTEGAR